MKKFSIAILKFIAPLLLVAIFIFLIPVDRKYAYSFVNKGGCEGRSSWIYRNLYEDSRRIDVAFIGTSHTMNAVNDELIEKQFNDSGSAIVHFKNLSYCGLGRDFDYIIIRDLLQHKKVKALVLEIREAEAQLGHQSFAHIATVPDLLSAPVYFNRSYFPDLYKGFLLHLQYLRESVTGEDIRHQVDIPESPFGFNGTDRTADSSELYEKRRPDDYEIDFLEKGLTSYPMNYVEQISKLAQENNTRLIFLYLPEFGHEMDTAKIQGVYGKFGPVIFPSPEILTNPTDWCDKGHLNEKAANRLSADLVQQLKDML